MNCILKEYLRIGIKLVLIKISNSIVELQLKIQYFELNNNQLLKQTQNLIKNLFYAKFSLDSKLIIWLII